MLMAKAFPRSSFVGIDISTDAIAKARSEARQQQLDNLIFMVSDAALLPDRLELKESFEAITHLIREIKVLTDKSTDSTEKAIQLFNQIKISCAQFLNIYFTIQLGHFSTSQHSTN